MARAAGGDEWDYRTVSLYMNGTSNGSVVVVGQSRPSVARVGTGHYGPHIALNDPAAVLRRCAADRRVLERHRPLSGTEVWSVDALYPVCAEEWSDGDGYRTPWHACPEVLALADRWGVEA